MEIELTKETIDHISERHLEGGESENRFCNTFLYRNDGLKNIAQYVVNHGEWEAGGDNRYIYYFNY